MIEIKPLTADLAAKLAGMHAECFGEACWSLEQIQGSLMLETTKGWLAEMDGAHAGFLLCQITDNEIEILTFGVLPGCRRQGIGETLLRHMLAEASRGQAVHLEVAADNGEARRLYEKLGFRHVSTRAGYYRRGEGAVDAVRYRFEATKNPENLQA